MTSPPGTEEQDPHGEVVREVLEPVLRPGGDEREVPRFASVALPVVNEHATAAHDDVERMKSPALAASKTREEPLHLGR